MENDTHVGVAALPAGGSGQPLPAPFCQLCVSMGIDPKDQDPSVPGFLLECNPVQSSEGEIHSICGTCLNGVIDSCHASMNVTVMGNSLVYEDGRDHASEDLSVETIRVVHPVCPWCRTGISQSVCEAILPDRTAEIRALLDTSNGSSYTIDTLLHGLAPGRGAMALTDAPELEDLAQSIRDFGDLVSDARANLRQLRARVEQETRQQMEQRGLVRNYLDGDRVIRARDAYLAHVDLAAKDFLVVCDAVQHVHTTYSQNLYAVSALVEDPGAPDEFHRAYEELVNGYSLLLESRELFQAGYEEQCREFAIRLDEFKNIVSEESNTTVAVLDAAIDTAQQAAAMGAAVAAVGTGVAVSAAATVGVVVLTTAAIGAGSVALGSYAAWQTASYVWDRLHGYQG
ncbi:hypothetical protein AB0N09_37965 [Streptomyces erythrochromogenes]|uniref:hypothetical protein n=1 Tax=Streptomyces erythrochromogenes TaxID=285574 RepID=UPI003426E632